MSGITYKINKLLEAKNLNKQDFANKIGVSRDTVYNWTDENFKVSVLLRVAEVLEVSVMYFLSDNKKYSILNDPAAGYGKKENTEDLQKQCIEYRNIITGLTKSLNALTDQLKKSK